MKFFCFFYLNERMYIYEYFINNTTDRENYERITRIVQLLRVIEVNGLCVVVTAIVKYEAYIVDLVGWYTFFVLL